MEYFLYFYVAFSYLVQIGVMSVEGFNLSNFIFAPLTVPAMVGRYLAITSKK